jgi:hypothetical protein
VNLSLTGFPTDVNGLPIAPYLPQTLTATISNNQNVMLLSKYRIGLLQLYAGYHWYQLAPLIAGMPETALIDVMSSAAPS